MSKKLRWMIPCGALVALGATLCVLVLVVVFVGGGRLAESLPTPAPRPTLVVGRTYWTSSIRALGEDWTYTSLYATPNGEMTYTSLKDATPVLLVGMEGDWCYVEAADEWGEVVEGWLRCRGLLGYEPTPVPTPDLTPKRPE